MRHLSRVWSSWNRIIEVNPLFAIDCLTKQAVMNASRVVNLCMKVNRYNSCEIAAKRIVIFNEISIMILLSSYVLLDKTVE